MLDWLWGSKPKEIKQSAENEADLSFLDPKLKEYYDSAKPATPIALAPENVKEEFKRQQEQDLETQQDKEVVTPKKQDELGTHQIQKEGEGLPLQQAARNNCVEYEMLLANCTLNGSYWDRFNLCQTFRKQHMRCIDLQEEALYKLGYQDAFTNSQRTQVQNKVDDVFSATVPDGPITDEVSEKFKNAVEQERQSTTIYRV